MTGITVDTDDLERANVLLQMYVGRVQMDANMLRGAAEECREIMGSDQYSYRAIQQIKSTITEINKAVQKAEELREQIIKKKNEIESSLSGF